MCRYTFTKREPDSQAGTFFRSPLGCSSQTHSHPHSRWTRAIKSPTLPVFCNNFGQNWFWRVPARLHAPPPPPNVSISTRSQQNKRHTCVMPRIVFWRLMYTGAKKPHKADYWRENANSLADEEVGWCETQEMFRFKRLAFVKVLLMLEWRSGRKTGREWKCMTSRWKKSKMGLIYTFWYK